MSDFDAVVVGAGIIGLACARELARRSRSVLVLERHERFGCETSSRNSEVVHAGIHYPPGSLKAGLCVRGNRGLRTYCEVLGVPFRPIGKVIVAVADEDLPKLEAIRANAAECGVALQPLTADEVRALEPHVRCVGGLWSPSTAIVDSHALMATILAELEASGGTLACEHEVLAAERCSGAYRLVARGPDGAEAGVTADNVVNAAGLDADTVAAAAGFDVVACGYRQRYARGHYFRVAAARSHLARHLIYPTPEQAGLGIHVTPDLAGSLRVGPDVEWLSGREQDYAVREELRAAFHASVSRYLEGLEEDDLAPDLAGIRPKLQGEGEPFRDFVIAEESERGMPGWVNLLGIESPGLTCCLEIGARVAALVPAARGSTAPR